MRRTQAELEAAKSRWFDLYDLAPVGYCTLNLRGQVQQANLAAASLLGQTRQAVLEQTFTRFIAVDDHALYARLREGLVADGPPQSCELRIARAGRPPCWVRLKASN